MNRRNATTLPEDFVLSEILPKLPAKSLIRFKCVSKEWLEIITNGTSLKKAHARHHTARNSASGGLSFIVQVLRRRGIGHQKVLFVSGDVRKPQINANPLAVEEFDIPYLKRKWTSFDIFLLRVLGSSNGRYQFEVFEAPLM